MKLLREVKFLIKTAQQNTIAHCLSFELAFLIERICKTLRMYDFGLVFVYQ